MQGVASSHSGIQPATASFVLHPSVSAGSQGQGRRDDSVGKALAMCLSLTLCSCDKTLTKIQSGVRSETLSQKSSWNQFMRSVGQSS